MAKIASTQKTQALREIFGKKLSIVVKNARQEGEGLIEVVDRLYNTMCKHVGRGVRKRKKHG